MGRIYSLHIAKGNRDIIDRLDNPRLIIHFSASIAIDRLNITAASLYALFYSCFLFYFIYSIETLEPSAVMANR